MQASTVSLVPVASLLLSSSSVNNRNTVKNVLMNNNINSHVNDHLHSCCSDSDKSSNYIPTTMPDSSSFDSGIEGVFIINASTNNNKNNCSNNNKHNNNINKNNSDSINNIATIKQTTLMASVNQKSNQTMASMTATKLRGNGKGRGNERGKSRITTSLTTTTTTTTTTISTNPMHKNLQEFQNILQALERDREHFYILRERLSNVSERNRKKSINERVTCNVCRKGIELNEPKSFVKCGTCQNFICRNLKCGYWLPKIVQWECELCQTSKESLAQTSSWVANQLSFHEHKVAYPFRARSEIYIPITDCNADNINFESVSQCDANSTVLTAEQKLKIREYVEEIVAKLLDSNFDGISSQSITNNNNYILPRKGKKTCNINENNNSYNENENGILSNNHQIINAYDKDVQNKNDNDSDEDVIILSQRKQSTYSTNISENRLRHIIQKIIGETITMPTTAAAQTINQNRSTTNEISSHSGSNRMLFKRCNPKRNNQYHRSEYYCKPRVYQDLLTTAVLNKIVNSQTQKKTMSESTPDLRMTARCEMILDQNCNLKCQSTTSVSSIESNSDCSCSEMDRLLNDRINHKKNKQKIGLTADRETVMSDYVTAHTITLPYLSTLPIESEEDDYLSVTSSVKGDGNWENNWLFKRKLSSISGNMTDILIPDPKEDVRAQIGDKAADEFSDLSELDSDIDETSSSLHAKLNPLNSRLLSKELIGGQNSKIILDELIEQTNVSASMEGLVQRHHHYTDTLNEYVVDAPIKNEAINSNINDKQVNYIQAMQSDDCAIREDDSSIAEREHKKWFNAVEMPNNPYAPEALRRRISGTNEYYIDIPKIQSPTKGINLLEHLTSQNLLNNNNDDEEQNQQDKEYRRYSRDYYINSRHKSSSNNSLCDINQEQQDHHDQQQRHHNQYHQHQQQDVTINQKRDDGKQRQGNVTDNVESNITQAEANSIITPTTTIQIIDVAFPTISTDTNINTNTISIINTNTNMHKSHSNGDPDIYKALPARVKTVVDDSISSIDTTVSSQKSIKSENTSTTSGDDTDTVQIYDFKTQETTVITQPYNYIDYVHNNDDNNNNNNDMDGNKSQESNKLQFQQQQQPQQQQQQKEKYNMNDRAISGKRERPKQLNFNNRSDSIGRGSTPTAFKFLQPKRKLINPDQVLSYEGNEPILTTCFAERSIIEEEVAMALPSVKTLARAFLLSSSTSQSSQPSTMEPTTTTTTTTTTAAAATTISSPTITNKTPKKFSNCLRKTALELSNSNTNLMNGNGTMRENVVINSDLLSLKTDPSSDVMENSNERSNSAIRGDNNYNQLYASNNGGSNGDLGDGNGLKHNIAFFENLKFK